MRVINITQHAASAAQTDEGIVCPHIDQNPFSAALRQLLTFDTIPTQLEISQRAEKIAKMARQLANFCGADAAMIGGAPFLMAPLERELKAVGLVPLYAFSKRESIEEVIDGNTVKRSVFAHVGFVGIENDRQVDGWLNKTCVQTAAGTRGASC